MTTHDSPEAPSTTQLAPRVGAARRPKRRRLLLLGLALGAGLAGAVATPTPARACGMEVFMAPPPSAEKLLAEAAREVRRGHSGLAGLRARRVISMSAARPEQRAAAYTILAWAELGRGDALAARKSLADAQALNRGAVSAILAVAPVDPTMQALRAAKKV